MLLVVVEKHPFRVTERTRSKNMLVFAEFLPQTLLGRTGPTLTL